MINEYVIKLIDNLPDDLIDIVFKYIIIDDFSLKEWRECI